MLFVIFSQICQGDNVITFTGTHFPISNNKNKYHIFQPDVEDAFDSKRLVLETCRWFGILLLHPQKPTAGSPENQVLEKDNKLTFETFMF